MANYRKCRRCCTHYLEVEFLAHRQEGYCTLECSIGEPRGIPTVESMAWKDKIMVSSLRERLPKVPPQELPLRVWKFDMVRYPSPIGWQIENWRLEDNDKILNEQTSKTDRANAKGAKEIYEYDSLAFSFILLI